MLTKALLEFNQLFVYLLAIISFLEDCIYISLCRNKQLHYNYLCFYLSQKPGDPHIKGGHFY